MPVVDEYTSPWHRTHKFGPWTPEADDDTMRRLMAGDDLEEDETFKITKVRYCHICGKEERTT